MSKKFITEQFVAGWSLVVSGWKDAVSLEILSHRADKVRAEGTEYKAVGMRCAIHAFDGWNDAARRDAKLVGVSAQAVDRLIEELPS